MSLTYLKWIEVLFQIGFLQRNVYIIKHFVCYWADVSSLIVRKTLKEFLSQLNLFFTLFMIRTDNAATGDITEKGSQNFQKESILQLFFSY